VRIISGRFRSKQIHPPSNIPVRPTTDFAKESLFNILNNIVDFEETRVLDLFAGTGSISFEFISRGSGQVTAIDTNPNCIAFIQRMAGEMKTDSLMAIRTDVFRFIKSPGTSYNLVFADPPYDMEEIDTLPVKILSGTLLETDGWFIMEHSRHYEFSEHPDFYDHRKYGNVHFTIFRKNRENK
jgi:16S rRNA (guanine966-N2)-methyltransferase